MDRNYISIDNFVYSGEFDTMKSCSLVYTFYNNQNAVDAQCRMWNSYPESVMRKLCIIAIDDGSYPPLRFDIDRRLPFILLRATEDIRWNQPGAKNLEMRFVPTEWALLTDADHMLTGEMAEKLLDFSPAAGTIYIPARLRNGQPCHPHPNSFIIRKTDFFAINGYDEDFCGNYGHDDHFFTEKARRQFTIESLDRIVLHNDQEYGTPDADRNHRKNKHLLKKKRAQLAKNRYKVPRMIRFNWEISAMNPPLLP